MFTIHNLPAIPCRGSRYELIDGMLNISPIPSRRHQRTLLRLAIQLDRACPPTTEVLSAPFAVGLSESTEVQPDLLVARKTDLTESHLPVAPLLAVEVLSDSTALYDLNTKKALYERIGTPSYWVIDPVGPALMVFELDDTSRYELVAEVKGDKAFDAAQPFPIRIVPAELLDD